MVEGKIYPPGRHSAVAFIMAYQTATPGTPIELRIASDRRGDYFITAKIEGGDTTFIMSEADVLLLFDAVAFSNRQTGRTYATEVVDGLKEALASLRELNKASRTRH